MRKIPLPVLISILVLVFFFLLSLLAPWIAPYHYDEQNVLNSYGHPSAEHWFGTDALGRDLLSRLLYGSRLSLSIAVITAASSIVLGTVYGCAAGYWGGWIDKVLMRFVDILYTLPTLIVMILVMLIFGRDFVGICIALSVTGWLGTARLMRAQVMSWKNRPFVEAAHSLGAKPFRVLAMHILPNCIAPLIVELSYQIPTNILAEAFLSFLGIGIRPPAPSWGVLAEEGWRALQVHPHMTLFPGLLIFCTMLSFNTLGDHLRDQLDPFLKRR